MTFVHNVQLVCMTFGHNVQQVYMTSVHSVQQVNLIHVMGWSESPDLMLGATLYIPTVCDVPVTQCLTDLQREKILKLFHRFFSSFKSVSLKF